ncbi:MAG: signal peptidase I [Sarcina sp.]
MEVIDLVVLKKNKNKIYLFSIICIILILSYMFSFTYIIGNSMKKTLNEGDIVLVSKTYEITDIVKGDVAIFDINYKGEKTRIIKRIIGVEGDNIKFENNNLYVNGIKIKENYVPEEMKQENSNFIVPEGKVFVLGDNRNKSEDSRDISIGFINFEYCIYGKAIFNISQFKKL